MSTTTLLYIHSQYQSDRKRQIQREIVDDHKACTYKWDLRVYESPAGSIRLEENRIVSFSLSRIITHFTWSLTEGLAVVRARTLERCKIEIKEFRTGARTSCDTRSGAAARGVGVERKTSKRRERERETREREPPRGTAETFYGAHPSWKPNENISWRARWIPNKSRAGSLVWGRATGGGSRSF